MIKAGTILAMCVALGACSLIPEKKPASQMTDDEFEKAFACPNTQTGQAQAKAFDDLYEFVGARHPNWNTQQIANFRSAIIERKKCNAGVQRFN